MRIKWQISKVIFISLFFISLGLSQTFHIIPSNSKVMFKVKHLGISTVTGTFDVFSGSFTYDAKSKTLLKAEAKIDASSINTQHQKRDKHLRAEDFFDVTRHPHLTFDLKKFVKKKGRHIATGTLNMRGVKKEINIEVEVGGIAKDPWGGVRMAFTGTASLDRYEYGLVWNKPLETGGLLVSKEVRIILEIEGQTK